MNKLVLAATIATFASAAHAGPLGPYDDLLIFGDSLSDPGNVFNDLSFNTVPDPAAYPKGMWSDNETWAVKLGYDYQPLESGVRRNYAHGGARSASDNPDTLDLFEQVATYRTPTDLGDNPLVAIFIGGNDFLNFKPVETPGTPEAEAEIGAFFGGIIGGIGKAITDLSATGLTDFLVFGVPDLGKRPLSENPAGESFIANLYNQALFGAMDALDMKLDPFGISIDTFDVAAALAPIFGPNTPFAVTDAPCVLKDADDNILSVCDNPFDYVAYDNNHPTDRVHGILAEAVSGYLQPIPLPAGAPLLLVGLAALGVASRRRVAGRSI